MAIFAVGAHATTADCSIERIRQQTQKCRDELRDKSTGNITADCRNGVLQEHVDCLSEITTCTDLVGTTELTLALEYGYSSVLLESTTGNTKKGCECSLSCTGGEGCSLSCGCTISFGKRESDITALDSTTCKLGESNCIIPVLLLALNAVYR